MLLQVSDLLLSFLAANHNLISLVLFFRVSLHFFTYFVEGLLALRPLLWRAQRLEDGLILLLAYLVAALVENLHLRACFQLRVR